MYRVLAYPLVMVSFIKLLFPHIRKDPIFGKLLKLSGDGLSVVFEGWWAVERG
jgi:hypothetical protein